MQTTILLVEENKIQKLVNERMLLKAGYTVLNARDREEALRLAREAIPDIILLDMLLPKLRGREVMQALRRDPPTAQIPVSSKCLAPRGAVWPRTLSLPSSPHESNDHDERRERCRLTLHATSERRGNMRSRAHIRTSEFLRSTLFVLVLVLGLGTSHQAAAQSSEGFPAFNSAAEAQHSQHIFLYASSEPKKPKILDRKFFLLAGMATAATVLDVATTSHCISTYAACQEGNPLVGSHPSQAKLYGVSFSMLAGQLLASAWIRRKMPNRNLWMILPIVATGGHGLAAALNIRKMHQLNK